MTPRVRALRDACTQVEDACVRWTTARVEEYQDALERQVHNAQRRHAVTLPGNAVANRMWDEYRVIAQVNPALRDTIRDALAAYIPQLRALGAELDGFHGASWCFGLAEELRERDRWLNGDIDFTRAWNTWACWDASLYTPANHVLADLLTRGDAADLQAAWSLLRDWDGALAAKLPANPEDVADAAVLAARARAVGCAMDLTGTWTPSSALRALTSDTATLEDRLTHARRVHTIGDLRDRTDNAEDRPCAWEDFDDLDALRTRLHRLVHSAAHLAEGGGIPIMRMLIPRWAWKPLLAATTDAWAGTCGGTSRWARIQVRPGVHVRLEVHRTRFLQSRASLPRGAEMCAPGGETVDAVPVPLHRISGVSDPCPHPASELDWETGVTLAGLEAYCGRCGEPGVRVRGFEEMEPGHPQRTMDDPALLRAVNALRRWQGHTDLTLLPCVEPESAMRFSDRRDAAEELFGEDGELGRLFVPADAHASATTNKRR